MKKPFYGWWIVAGALILLFSSTGTQFYAFPVFFDAIVRDTGWARADTAAALSIGMFVAGTTGIIVGGLIHKIGIRVVLVAGSLIAGLGFFLLSTAEQLFQLYIYYSLLVGIGATCISLIPNLSAVESWFTYKRSLALGIATVGIGLGGAVMPPLASWLIARYDWQTAFIFMAGIVLVIGIPVSIFVMRYPRADEQIYITEKKTDPNTASFSGLTLRQALKSRPFWCISIGVMLWAWAYGTGVVHQVAFAVDIGLERGSAAGAVGLLAVLSIPGRLGFGKLGDIIDKRYVFMIGTCLQVVAFLVLSRTTSITMLYLYSCLIGLNVGSMAPILPGILADRFGHRYFGSIYGAAFFMQTIGMVIGPISGGLIYDRTGSYTTAFLIATVISIVAIVSVFLAGKRQYHTDGK